MAIRDYLSQHRVRFELLLHQPVTSATRRAQCLHVPGRCVAKAVLVRLESGYVLAVLPATHRIDLDRLGRCLNQREPRLATEDEAERIFHDCERGALPPFGRAYGLRTIVDASLAGSAEIVVEGNHRHEGLRLRYQDFEQIELPMRGRFAESGTASQRRPHRQAG